MSLRWILDHLWVIIAVAAVLARIFSKAKGQGEEGTDGQPPKEYEFEDPELAERTRKIREEIQRKIAERNRRQSQPVPGPGTAPTPVTRSPEATTPPAGLPEIFREVLQPQPPPLPASPPPLSRAAVINAAEEAERQATLLEKLREAELMKAASVRRAAFEASTVDQSKAERTANRTSVVGDLRDPLALRRAFITREIIGPPVALR